MWKDVCLFVCVLWWVFFFWFTRTITGASVWEKVCLQNHSSNLEMREQHKEMAWLSNEGYKIGLQLSSVFGKLPK